MSLTPVSYLRQARKALADRQKELELKTQQLEIKLSNKIEEDIKKARRKSTQAGQSRGVKGQTQGSLKGCSHTQVFLVSGRKENCLASSHVTVGLKHISVTGSGC